MVVGKAKGLFETVHSGVRSQGGIRMGVYQLVDDS